MIDDEETLLFNLVYCSRATEGLTHADIDSLVAAARRKNAQRQITGWLVYSSGVFFQWLEGSREPVKALMAAIAADSRHSTVVVLSEAEEVRERLFSGWDMERVSPEDIRAVLLDAIGSSSDANTLASLQVLSQELDRQKIGDARR